MKILLACDHPELATLVQKSLQRFDHQFEIVENGLDVFQRIILNKYDLLLMNCILPRMNAPEVLRRVASIENFKLPPCLIFISDDKQRSLVEDSHLSDVEVLSFPFDVRRFVSKVQQALHQGSRVVCIGGGTGLYTLLSGLKTLPNLNLTAIVSMSDDGGSTGRLRDMFGILPPGDVRRSLVALSTAPDLLNQLIQYRFERGEGLIGHNLGNLLLTALHEMRGSMVEAVRSLAEILNIQGQVIPVTEIPNTLHAELSNGRVIEGESRIGLFDTVGETVRIEKLWQKPRAIANPDAIESILNAQYLLLGPGDLFTSIVSNLIVEGIAESIKMSRSKKIYICNIMTKPGETAGFQIEDHIREITRYCGGDFLDAVVCSATPFSEEAIQHYADQNQRPVQTQSLEVIRTLTRAKIVFEDVASEKLLVRHDSLKLAYVLKRLFDVMHSPEALI